MKKTILALTLIFSQASFATVLGSSYEARHLKAIEEAITRNCGNFGELKQLRSFEEVINVDNGIRDIRFTTVLTGLKRMDQNIFDEYVIVVGSDYSDMYDHQSKDWGVYSVSDVTCEME